MNKIFKQVLILFCLLAILILPYFVFAADSLLGKLKDVGTEGGYAEADTYSFSKILGKVVSAGLSLLGVIFIILVLLAGYNWMTAQGDEQKVEKARETLWRAVIGLIITLSAYAIWEFIIRYVGL